MHHTKMEKPDSKVNQIQGIQEMKNISLDSLNMEEIQSQKVIDVDMEEPSPSLMTDDHSIGPALTMATSSFDSPAHVPETPSLSSNKRALSQDGDIVGAGSVEDGFQGQNPLIVEAREYADDLVRELINDTERIVREDHSGLSSRTMGEEIGPEEDDEKEKNFDQSAALTWDMQRDQEAQGEEGNKEKEVDVVDEKIKKSIDEISDNNKLGSSIIGQQEDSTTTSKNISIHNNNQNDPKPDDSLRLTNTIQEAHQSFQTAAGNSILVDSDTKLVDMEFTKNYSDDLLMGQNNEGSQQGEPLGSGGADLADFELPPYSGSSSGSENKQHSPTHRKQPSSSAQPSSSSQVNTIVSPPNLAAVKNLLLSSYSRVSHVFHWRKPIETGVYFSIGVTLITALTFFSIISVVAYSALGIILTSGSMRLYKTVMKMLSCSSETPFDHVWDKVLSLNVSLSTDKVHELVDSSLGNLNASFVYFKQVLLVEDKLATLKFGLFLYMLTYIGAWFNGMTLITLSFILLFSAPIFYEKNKTNIDGYLSLATGQISSAICMVKNKATSLASGSMPVASTSGGGKKLD